MRAIMQRRFGTEGLELTEIDRPEPIPTEVLVRVHAAGVNPVDWKTSAGLAGPFFGTPPYVPGWDVAGVVEVSMASPVLAPGDEVLGMPLFPRRPGGYAEYVAAPSRHFVRKPATLSFTEAAALPLAGLTAWQALVDAADLQPGQRVLVTAAAGGVGHLAVQIAKARGAHVIGTASAGKHDFLRELGVDQPVDYTTDELDTAVRDVDVALGLVGDEDHLRALGTLRPGGVLVGVAGGAPESVVAEAERRGVRAESIMVEPDLIGLRALVDLVERDQLRVVVDQVLPLEQAAKAHELGFTNRTTGKIVLSVRD